MINYILSFTVVRVLIMLAYFTWPWWLIILGGVAVAVSAAGSEERAEKRWARQCARYEARRAERARQRGLREREEWEDEP